MLKRRPLLALTTLAALAWPALAMCDASSSDAKAAPAETLPADPETGAKEAEHVGGATLAPARPAIRRTPPVTPRLRLLPPVSVAAREKAERIPAGSADDSPRARQVAATLPVGDKRPMANEQEAERSPAIAKGDLVPQAEAVSPWSVREMPAAHRVTRPATPAPVQLTANRFHQEAPAPPPPPEPTIPSPVGPPFDLALAADVAPPEVAEPVPPVADLTPEAPLAGDHPAIQEADVDDYGYGYCDPCGGPFRRRHHPVVCYHDRPFGWYVRNANQIQVSRGFEDQMVLYHYDFQEGEGEDQLSSRGRQQLAKFAAWVDTHGYPVVIQPAEGRPELDAARQAHVAMELSTMTEAAAENSVIVARPRAHGLCGTDAYEIDQNLIQQTQQRGRLMSGSGSGFGFSGLGLETGLSGSSP